MRPSPDPAERLRRIHESPAYRLAYEDTELLNQDGLRPLRLQLELLKPERVLDQEGVHSTVVVFGSARVSDTETARARLTALEQHAGDTPAAAQAAHLARARVRQAQHYEQARRFAHLISARFQQQQRREFVVVTGGGPGIMEAANRGAFEAGARSVGLNITLPQEQGPNSYISPELAFRFHYFAIRKMHFVMRAKAVAVFPGGFGTMDEFFETLTLIQTGRMERVPVILFGKSFWERAIDLDFLAEQGTITPGDQHIIDFVDTAEEAWDIIRRFYKLGE